MSDQLSPLDATFLELEQADESANMNIGAVLVFDPLPAGGVPSVEQVREHLHRRLDAMPRYRQRLSEPRTGGLSWPRWVDAERFDIADHVRRATLPAPGAQRELDEWAADFWSHRCDRARPLWEIVLLDGLEDGRWALATKTHHTMIDGVGSVDVGHLMLDLAPGVAAEPPSRAPELASGASGEDRGDRGLVGGALGVARTGMNAFTWPARTGADLALHPRKLTDLFDRSRAMVDVLVRDELVAAPPSSLNVPIGSTRRYAVVRARLADVKLVARELGGTVNDTILSAAAGGLRTLLLARGDDPPEAGLRAMVPVNVRRAGEELALGNRVSSLFVHLPVREETALGRHARTVEEAEGLKASRQDLGTGAIVELTGLAPPALHAALARALYATRLFNVTITNVPGPQTTLYAFGAPMREVLPLVPLAAEHAIGVAIVSYDGQIVFGLNADRGAVPDLDVLADGIAASLDELIAHARGLRPQPARTG